LCEIKFVWFLIFGFNLLFLVAKLPLNVSTVSNKRLLENDENLENNKKKRIVSKSAPIEKSAGKR